MTPQPITTDNFNMAYDQIKTAYFLLSMFDWAALVEARNRADGFMHITDPTGYQNLINSQNAKHNHEAAKAADQFVRALRAIQPEATPND